MFIEGDNLEVLKLLQKAYNDKVKLIYIDPPYNTGNDFVYNDDFSDPLQHYLEVTGQVDAEGNRLVANTETSGRKHSNWLTMMYPRLVLARNLLTQDGTLLISIDDNELDNLLKICKEVFGEENVSLMVWNKEAEGSSGSLKAVSTYRRIHEYVVVCHRDTALAAWTRVREAVEGRESELQTANLAVNAQNENTKHANYFPIKNENGDVFIRQWKWSKSEIDRLISEGLIFWGSDGRKQPRLIIPLDDRRMTYLRSILNYGGTTAGRKDFERILGADIEFSYPKPVLLLKKLILAATSEADLVMDFFAGSGTTGQAVLEANAEDGASRKFVLVTLGEGLENPGDLNFRTVADICLARVSAVIRSVEPEKVGLRVLRLGASPFEHSSSNGSEILLNPKTLKSGAADEDAAMSVLLNLGIPLHERWESTSEPHGGYIKAGNVTFSKAKVSSQDVIDLTFGTGSETVVFLEDSFEGIDSLKANAFFRAKTENITLKTF